MTMTFLDLLLIGPVFLIALLSLFMMVKQSAKNFLNKYVMQSILVAVAVLGLFFSESKVELLFSAAIIIVGKVVLLPMFFKRFQAHSSDSNENQHVNWKYVIAIAIIVGLVLIGSVAKSLINLNLSGEFFAASLASIFVIFTGLLILLNQVGLSSKLFGYLVIENGVFLFGLFIAHVPIIFELLIIFDLVFLVFLVLGLSLSSQKSNPSMSLPGLFRKG